MLQELLQGLVDDPHGDDRWLVLADWLEENDNPLRAEFVRLHRALIGTCLVPELHPDREQQQARLVELLTLGVVPCVPQCSVAVDSQVTMTFSWIPPGSFLMGSVAHDPEIDPDEAPQHRVAITRGFWLGIYPVTQQLWEVIEGSNPSGFAGSNRPVESVSWHDCQAFCHRLGKRTREKFRLPTEAEWELACRAGTTTPYYTGTGMEAIQRAGWCSYLGIGEAGGTRPVGELLPNFWGLYDMHGNVWEWCSDWCDEQYYEHSPEFDPTGPSTGSVRMLRGGSWEEDARYSRSTHRCWYHPNVHFNKCGLRLVLEDA